MHGEITADLTAMPVSNLITLLVGFALLLVIAASVIIVIVRKLGIKNFGPIQMEHNNTATMYEMNDKIRDIDDVCHKQMHYVTDKIKIHISNIFVDVKVCVPTRISISSVIRFPLYESVSNNHFTSELMPEHYPMYRRRIIENMRDEYISLLGASKHNHCSRDVLPPWEETCGQLVECVDLWLGRVGKIVMDACESKVAVYSEFMKQFELSKDSFRAGICRECIDKNERYIRELKRIALKDNE